VDRCGNGISGRVRGASFDGQPEQKRLCLYHSPANGRPRPERSSMAAVESLPNVNDIGDVRPANPTEPVLRGFPYFAVEDASPIRKASHAIT
jgi:hypothetical protein